MKINLNHIKNYVSILFKFLYVECYKVESALKLDSILNHKNK
jgi:hypothetical protein